MIKIEKELELINDLSIGSLNLCRLLIRESVKLKLNINVIIKTDKNDMNPVSWT